MEYVKDNRNINDFKNTTFSGYKKTNVKNELLKSLTNNNIEASCYWCAELICSGEYLIIWNICLEYSCKYIHIGNPKLPSYLVIRYENFKEIILNCNDTLEELNLRNNKNIRNLFCEVICILCCSNKREKLNYLKIKEEEFNINFINTKLLAPSTKFVSNIFQDGDPQSLFIALNEFSYNLSEDCRNNYSCFYWLEWILEFENICKKKKEVLCVNERKFVLVEDKFKKDIIWIIWDIIIYYNNDDRFKIKLIYDLLKLYSIRYTISSKRKRKYIIYHAINITTNVVNTNINIFNNKELIKSVTNKIDIIYSQIINNNNTNNISNNTNNISNNTNNISNNTNNTNNNNTNNTNIKNLQFPQKKNIILNTDKNIILDDDKNDNKKIINNEKSTKIEKMNEILKIM